MDSAPASLNVRLSLVVMGVAASGKSTAEHDVIVLDAALPVDALVQHACAGVAGARLASRHGIKS